MKVRVRWMVLLTVVTPLVVNAQVYLPKKAYMHLVGRIDTDREVVLNLVKVNDSIFGDLVYTGDRCGYAVIAGVVNEAGMFSMRYPYCDTGKVFRGSFITRQTVSGNYESTDGKESLPFVMAESYPEGAIPLLVYYLHTSKHLVDRPGTPTAEISQCLIVPGESSNPVISDTLKKRMISGFTGKQAPLNDPDEALLSVQKNFFGNYISSNRSLYETMPDAGSLNWVLLKFMHILYNDHNLLTYYLLNYAYTGGAHGLETQDFTVVNTNTGKTVGLAELFVPGYETRLTSILTSKLKEMVGIPPAEKLTENGFFVDEVKPNTNFYITAGGIGFYYNHYEIAPYVNGPTDILIPFKNIRGILREEGPVATLLNRR